MELKTLFKITLMFSACFLGVSLLLVHEFAGGFLSPRAMGTALLLLCLCIAGGSIFVLTMQKRSVAQETSLKNLSATQFVSTDCCRSS